jgi:hypothetical protein
METQLVLKVELVQESARDPSEQLGCPDRQGTWGHDLACNSIERLLSRPLGLCWTFGVGSRLNLQHC